MIALTNDSAQSYSATIPALNSPGVVKFYVEASDAGANTTREPFTGEYTVTVGVSNPPLMITEFMAGNSNTIVDNHGATEDWIEIKNTGINAVDLGDKYLTDDLTKPDKFRLPGISLEPDQYYIIWADNDKEQGPNHANFKLSASGESIGLFDSYTTNPSWIT